MYTPFFKSGYALSLHYPIHQSASILKPYAEMYIVNIKIVVGIPLKLMYFPYTAIGTAPVARSSIWTDFPSKPFIS